MPKKPETPSRGTVQVAKSLNNFYMFFVPPISDMEAFNMPTTTAVKEIQHQDYPNGTAIKFSHPRLPHESKSDEIFINYAREVSAFLKRSFDGLVHFVPLESDIKQ